MQAQDLTLSFTFLRKLAEPYRNQEEWSWSERGPQEKGGEPAGLVAPLGWGRPGGELYTLELGGVRQLGYGLCRLGGGFPSSLHLPGTMYPNCHC